MDEFPTSDVVQAQSLLAWAMDRRDWPRVGALMTRSVHAYGRSGVEHVLDLLRVRLDMTGATQHLLGNVLVALDGPERARLRSYVRVHHDGAGPWADRFWECLAEYEDRWIRDDGGWLLSRRTITVRNSWGDPVVIGRPDLGDAGRG